MTCACARESSAERRDRTPHHASELYDLTKDWTQDNDLAASNSDKLRQMQELFMVEAAKYQVFPLDNTLATRLVLPRPSVTAGRNVFTYTGELAGIPMDDAPQLLNTSHTITADIEIPESRVLGIGTPQQWATA